MADAKISALTNLTAADPTNDMIPIVDVSDTPPASGNTKRISINNILSSSPTASGALTVTGLVTAGSATITGAATVGTTLGVTGVSTFAAGTALLPALTTTGDTNTGIYYPAADTFAVTTGGTERYRVDAAGNIGVQNAPSAWTSSVRSIDIISGGLSVFSGGVTHNAFYDSVDGRWEYKGTGAATFHNYQGGIHEWYVAASGTANTAITTFGAGSATTLNASSNLVLKGGTTTANGVGLTFPATQSASSDANCLDDYEEGTWTGTLTGGTTNPTTTQQATGRYTKVGRVVTVQIYFNNVNTLGASGLIGITGLPFTNNASVGSTGIPSFYNIATFTGSPIVALGVNESFLNCYSNISNTAFGNVTHNAGASGNYFTTSITYTVA